MPNRILREGILTSERVNSLTTEEEIFYRRLISVVDDYGRYYAKPELLRSACFPLKIDRVSNEDISKWMQSCATHMLIKCYHVEKTHYLELIDFKQQVRAKQSKFPCVADDTHMQEDDHLDVVVDEDGVVGGGGKKTTIPKNFCLTDQMIEYAKKKGITDRQQLENFTENFIGSCKAKGYKYADFYSAWQTWLRGDIEKGKFKKDKTEEKNW